MNWDDVATLLRCGPDVQIDTPKLPLKELTQALRTGVATVRFRGPTTADTDLRNMQRTVFMLSGAAEIVMHKDELVAVFRSARSYCLANGISCDPVTWVFIGPAPTTKTQAALTLIRENEVLHDDFLNDAPTTRSVVTDVVLRTR